MYFPICLGILLGTIGTFISTRFEELKGVYNRVKNMKMCWQPKLAVGSLLTWNVVKNTDSSVGIAKRFGDFFYVKVVDETYKPYYILFKPLSNDHRLYMTFSPNSPFFGCGRIEITPSDPIDTIGEKMGYTGYEVVNVLSDQREHLGDLDCFKQLLENHDDGPVE
jgi:hypothetical protein